MSKKPKIEKWVLTPHAVERMRERKITLAELTETIEKPKYAIMQGPKWIFAKDLKGRKDNLIASVMLQKESDLWVVITVMVRFKKRN